MPRKGENIYKRKDGRWEARYIKYDYINGKKAYGYVYGKTYKEVKEKKLHAQRIDSCTSDIESSIKDTRIFESISEQWLLSIKGSVKESTYVKYFNIVHLYLLKSFRNWDISTFTFENINEFCNQLLIKGGKKEMGLAPKTVSDIMFVFKSILQYAKFCGYKIDCDLRALVIKKQQPQLKVLSIEEQSRLINFLYSELNERNLGIIVCLFTGLRIGEICALQWEDISLEEKSIYVHATMQRIQDFSSSKARTKIIITSPKSSCSIRTIPLPNNIVELLYKFYKGQKGYVLTGSEIKYIEPRVMQRYFCKVLRAVSLKDVTFHTLRHTFATRCVEKGVDIKILSEILGHSSVNITMNRYVHPSMELKKNQIDRISDLFAVK